MFPYTYSELNAQYNFLVRELSCCPDYIPGSNDSDNFTPFYIKILQLNILTKMMLHDSSHFEYSTELDAVFSDVVYWLDNRLNFFPLSSSKMNKGYEKYIVLEMLLDDDCESYWHNRIKKSFMFFFKKIHYPYWIARWVIDSTNYAEENGLLYFSWLFSKNHLSIFEEHGELTRNLRNGIIGYYNRGVDYMKTIQ